MPQPTLAIVGGIGVCKFGSLALPNGQGAMAQINLNDGKQWLLQKLGESGGWDYDNKVLQLAPYVFRARSTYLSRDWSGLKVVLPLVYNEDTSYGGDGAPIGAKLALMANAGEQQLTFDNSTALVCEFSGAKNRKLLNLFTPLLWSFELELVAKQGWYVDIASSSNSPVAVTGTTGGSTTNFNVTYPGSIFCEPSYVLSIGVGNTATVSQLVLTNTMSGEALTINFPTPLAAGTAWTLTINSATMQISDQNAKQYDFSGSFPMLYGPAGQVNAFSCKITTGVNSLGGSPTLQTQWTNRWMF